MTTEEKARAYAESRIAVKNVRVMCITPREKRLEHFDAYDIEQAYEDGATEALASQWVSVEVRLPEDNTLVAVWINSTIFTDFRENGKWHHYGVRFWLPIPPLKGGDE